jgi:thiol:disulfide interchange protein
MKLRTILAAVSVLAAAISLAASLNWASDYKSALAKAKQSHKVVMVDFTASWCVNCHKLDKTTYIDPTVVKLLGKTVAVHVDFDKEKALDKKYNIKALPVILFVDGNGKELGRIPKYVDAKQFVALARPILAKAK